MLLNVVALLSAAMGGVGDGAAIKNYSGGWDLYKNTDNCALMRNYAADTTLHISYFGDSDTIKVTMLDPALKGIVDGADYKFKLLFLKDKNLDTGWGLIKVKGIVLGKEHGYRFTVSGQTFLDDLNKNDLFGLMDGENVIESLKLDQALPALQGLKTCALGGSVGGSGHGG